MKLRIALPVAALGLASLVFTAASLIAGDTRHALALTNCTTSSDGLSPAESQMLGLVNGARGTAGLGPLSSSPNLNRAAAWKSEDQAAHSAVHDHVDSLGRVFSRFTDCGYPGGASGENIAWGSSDVGQIFAAWMASGAHRANILNPAWRVAGTGLSGSEWTMDFGSFDDSGAPAPAPQPSPTPTVGFPTSTPTTYFASPSASATASASASAPANGTASPSPTATSTSSNQATRRPRAFIAMLAVSSDDE